jgi:chromate transport protein ChrA
MAARLGPYNLALVACYAAPTWGAEAIKALTSPYRGLVDPVHAAAAVRLRVILKLAPERLLDVANWLAAFKLVVVAALLAYVIEFARALLSDRAPDRATTDAVLVFAVVAVATWIMQAIVFDPAAVTQAHVAQLLLVAGALIVSTIERHIEDMAAAARVAGASASASAAAAGTPAQHC